jgi:integrase
MTRKAAYLVQRTLDDFIRGAPEAPSESNSKWPRLELDPFSFPPAEPKDPRGRPSGTTKYVVRVMPASTRQKVAELIRSVNSDAATIIRLVTHYREFQAMNSLERDDVALMCFIVDIGQQGLAPSTCRSYTRLILEGSARQGRRVSGPLVGDLMKALNLQEAEGDTKHAIDVPREKLNAILKMLPKGALRLTFYLLLHFGCRAADAARLSSRSFFFETDGRVRLFFKVTKNHRRRSESYCIVVRPNFFIDELVEMLRIPEGTGLPVLACDAFNRQIATFTSDAEGTAGLTSYTLRRSFIQEVIARNTCGDTTDWLECAKMTGHRDLEVLRTSYTRSVFDATL